MNIRAISRNIGYALLVSALFMFLSVLVSMINGNDSALAALIISFTITFLVGVFPFIFVRKPSPITLKEGYLIVTLSWLLSFVFGMLPYVLWGGPFSIQNAWFESVSGFTTTGATILENIEALPASLLFWRASTHFIGGLGVVVFLLLIIPNSSPIRMRFTNMELSSLSKGGYASQPGKTVSIFAIVYLSICLLAFVSYLLAGMGPLDAICHAMSVCATGGFSSRNLSIASFDSPLIEILTFIFMLVASIHFGVLYLAVVNKSLKPLNNTVTKAFLGGTLVVSLIVGLSLKISGNIPNLAEALWVGAFQTVCVVSTTGFAIADNAEWPMYVCLVMMLASIVCGCAGSTTGGVKVDRVLMMLKSFGIRIGKILRPSSVAEVKFGRKTIPNEEVLPHILYILLFVVAFAISTTLASIFEPDFHNAFSASLSSLTNLGPAIRELGTMGNFNSVSGPAKFLYTFDMFLGRVEIYPVLAVFAMIFGPRRK